MVLSFKRCIWILLQICTRFMFFERNWLIIITSSWSNWLISWIFMRSYVILIRSMNVISGDISIMRFRRFYCFSCQRIVNQHIFLLRLSKKVLIVRSFTLAQRIDCWIVFYCLNFTVLLVIKIIVSHRSCLICRYKFNSSFYCVFRVSVWKLIMDASWKMYASLVIGCENLSKTAVIKTLDFFQLLWI